MTIVKGTINTDTKLTKVECNAKELTGKTKQEILLMFRYRPITPIAEDANYYFYQVHRYLTLEYKVNKERCVTTDKGQVYCLTEDYATVKA